MNKQCAEGRQGLYLRIPQPAQGHCLSIKHEWSEDEASHYFADGTLPVDLTTLDPNGVVIFTRVFDARNCGDQLPEVELEHGVLPDFEKWPAMCLFDVGGGSYEFIASEFLDMVSTAPYKVRFVRDYEKTRLQRSNQPEG